MFVKSVMIPKEKCAFLQVDDSIQHALELLEEKELDALPVLDGEEYIGLFNRYQAYRAFFYAKKEKEQFLRESKLSDIVTMQDTYLNLESVFEDSFFELKDFPIIAVVEEGKFLGIVTRFDIVNQFQSAFGIHREGVRITITSVETEGRIAQLADVIQKFHYSVISLITFDETDKLMRRIVMKVEKHANIDAFLKELDRSGFRVLHIKED